MMAIWRRVRSLLGRRNLAIFVIAKTCSKTVVKEEEELPKILLPGRFLSLPLASLVFPKLQGAPIGSENCWNVARLPETVCGTNEPKMSFRRALNGRPKAGEWGQSGGEMWKIWKLSRALQSNGKLTLTKLASLDCPRWMFALLFFSRSLNGAMMALWPFVPSLSLSLHSITVPDCKPSQPIEPHKGALNQLAARLPDWLA